MVDETKPFDAYYAHIMGVTFEEKQEGDIITNDEGQIMEVHAGTIIYDKSKNIAYCTKETINNIKSRINSI